MSKLVCITLMILSIFYMFLFLVTGSDSNLVIANIYIAAAFLAGKGGNDV